jgi:arylsulfatase A-like enzyme
MAQLESYSAYANFSEPEHPERRNIVLICCDALRGGLGKAAGIPFDISPCLDRLAAAGTSFRHAYCTMPLCVPSRISMLTGRWPDAHRVRMNLDAKDVVCTKDIYRVAKGAGYKTGLSGKNHTYLKPGDVDFWSEYGHEGGRRDTDAPAEIASFEEWLKKLDMNVAQEATPFPLEVQLSYRIVSDALRFVRQANGTPFFLQISFPEPHGPIQVPKPYWNMFDPAKIADPKPGAEALAKLGYRMEWLNRLEEDGSPGNRNNWRRYLSNYFGAIRMVDDQIARFLSVLDEMGLRQQTLIVFVADHGDFMMQYGVGRKGVGLSEALTHIPMIWSGGGLPASETNRRDLVSMADLMPTLCDAMQQPIPDGVQGRSLWKTLHGDTTQHKEFESVYVSAGLGGLYYDASDDPPLTIGEAPRDHHLWDTLNMVTQSGNQKMVRVGDWKLIYDMMGYGQLYHLLTDPYELDNRFGQASDSSVQSKLMQELARWTIYTENTIPKSKQSVHSGSRQPD